MNARALGLLALVVLIFGAAFPALKLGIEAGASPLWLAMWRAALSALVATLVLAATRRLAWPGRADLLPILGIGVFQISVFFAAINLALVLVPAGRSAVLSYTTALWLVPISVLVLGEALSARRLAAVALGIAGIAVIAGPWALDWTRPGLVLGHALLLGAGLAWAVAIAILRVARPALSTLQLLPFAFLVATACLLALALARDPHGAVPLAPVPLGALAYVGVFGVLATWASSELSRRLPPVVSATGFLGVPVLGLALSVLVLGEAADWPLLLGAALVIAGLAVASRA